MCGKLKLFKTEKLNRSFKKWKPNHIHNGKQGVVDVDQFPFPLMMEAQLQLQLSGSTRPKPKPLHMARIFMWSIIISHIWVRATTPVCIFAFTSTPTPYMFHFWCYSVRSIWFYRQPDVLLFFCFVVNYLFVIHVFSYLCIGSCIWNERILEFFQHVWILWLELNMWSIHESFIIRLVWQIVLEKNFICTCTYVTIVRFYYLVLHLDCIFICTSMLNVILGIG